MHCRSERRTVLTTVAAIGCVLAAACGDAPAPVADDVRDAWFNPPAAQDVEPEPLLPGAFWRLVTPERRAEAETFLAHEMVSQISPGEVEYFAGEPVELPDVTRPWLVRALYRTVPEFTISIVGNALWVTSLDEPDDTAPMQRLPLVLVMDEVPETVYVTTGRP